jgi:DNA polymerase-4
MRKIIHIDADCFYAAVEVRDNPALKGLPIAVGGDADRRGVIATASYEARRFGVHAALATAQARKRCPQLIVLPGRMNVYKEASQAMHEIFKDYTDLIEPLSLDEAFLDVSECEQCHGSATLIAEEIRQRIFEAVGITVSAGIAPNKFIAKIASDWKKPNGQFVVTPDDLDDFIRHLPVKKIWGVGKVTAEKLQRADILTCEDVRKFTVFEFAQKFGSFGEHIYKLAQGIDDRPVRNDRRRKSMSVEHTYPQDITSLKVCKDKLPELLVDLSARMEKLDGDYQVQGVILKMKFSDFVQTTVEQICLAPDLSVFEQLCEQAWARGKPPVRLLGVGVRLRDLSNIQQQLLLDFNPDA